MQSKKVLYQVDNLKDWEYKLMGGSLKIGKMPPINYFKCILVLSSTFSHVPYSFDEASFMASDGII